MSKDGAQGVYVCLDNDDCKILTKEMNKIIKKYENNLQKFEDIHDSGEATEGEEDMRLEAQEMYDCMFYLQRNLKEYVNLMKTTKKRK